MAFPDIVSMYPSVNVLEANSEIVKLYSRDKGERNLPNEELLKALQLCQECNGIEFMNRYYIPKKGISMGPSHACDLTDIWIGPIAKNCNIECKIEHVGF